MVLYQNPLTGTRWNATGDNVALLLSWGWVAVAPDEGTVALTLDEAFANAIADADSLTRDALDGLGLGGGGLNDADVAALVADDDSATAVALRATIGSRAQQSITYPEHLEESRKKIGASQFRRFDVTVIGNSIAAGFFAGENSDNEDPIHDLRGWVAQTRNMVNARLGAPAPGEGIIPLADYRISRNGGQDLDVLGITRATPGGIRLYNAPADWVELDTVAAATTIEIHGWQQTNAECSPFQISIDGGTAVTVTTDQGFPSTGDDVDYTVRITGLSDAAHTVRVLGASGNLIDLSGFSAWSGDPDRGVAVHRIAVGGGYLNTVLYDPDDGDAFHTKSNRITLGRTSTDLLVLAFGANESSTTGQGVGHTPTNYEALLRNVVDYATDTYGCDVLLLSTGRQNPSQVSTFGEEVFYAIHEEIAAENPRVAHLDMKRVWGTYAAAVASDLMYDAVHPNLTGHGDMANLVAAALTSL